MPVTDSEIKALNDKAFADVKAQGTEVIDFDIPDSTMKTSRESAVVCRLSSTKISRPTGRVRPITLIEI
jgi:hypothetical protein